MFNLALNTACTADQETSSPALLVFWCDNAGSNCGSKQLPGRRSARKSRQPSSVLRGGGYLLHGRALAQAREVPRRFSKVPEGTAEADESRCSCCNQSRVNCCPPLLLNQKRKVHLQPTGKGLQVPMKRCTPHPWQSTAVVVRWKGGGSAFMFGPAYQFFFVSTSCGSRVWEKACKVRARLLSHQRSHPSVFLRQKSLAHTRDQANRQGCPFLPSGRPGDCYEYWKPFQNVFRERAWADD